MAHIQKRVVASRRTGKPVTRWQARYRGPDGRERTRTFDRQVDARAWLDTNSADVTRGAWIDPRPGRVTLRHYADRWLTERHDLRPSTRAKYRGLLDRHILPDLGDTSMTSLSATAVRGWHARLLARHLSTAAGAYRLLATICHVAVADRVIAVSPCQVKGAAAESAAERPTITVPELAVAVEAAPDRWRLAILLAAWCQLRRGEVLGLQRQNVDTEAGSIAIRRAVVVSSCRRCCDR